MLWSVSSDPVLVIASAKEGGMATLAVSSGGGGGGHFRIAREIGEDKAA
jgi:hypothetical protein